MNFFIGITGGLILALIITLFLLIPILIMWRVTKKVKSYSKTSVYNVASIFLIIFGVIALLITGINYIENLNSRKSTDATAVADGYTIDSYNVKLDVKKNSEVDVTETIGINFYEEGHHGIYKTIPTWLEYTPKNGQTISRESNIEDLKAVDDKYIIESVGTKERIKIGEENVILPTGLKVYTIKYKYYMGNDPYKGFDEFIFHNFGDYWGTEINNASVEITMPEDIDVSKVKFFADKYRKKDISSNVYYYTDKNTLYATVSSLYNLRKSLTIDIELPEGYFNKAESNYGYLSLTFCLLIIMITLIVFVKWIRYGKDYDKVSETVEFYAPEGLDAAEIGYIYKWDSGKKLAIAIIVELASKGYIKIDEDKDTRTITNLCSKNIDAEINRKVVAIKLRDVIGKNDIDIVNEIFKDNSSRVEITSDFDNFYNKTKKLVSDGYIKIESDTINNYTKEEIDNIIKEKQKKLSGLTSNEKIVYNQLFKDKDVNVISSDTEFYTVFAKITENLEYELADKIKDVKSYKQMMISSALFFINCVYFRSAFSIYKDLDPKYKILYLITFILLIVCLVLTILMKRRNTYGEQIKAKVEGFKNYLETAEKDQLEVQAMSNPNYFYDILPYAYVLGVSKVWIDKFKDIPMPKSEMGSFDYYNVDSYDSLSSSIYSGSSSSSSGGCSSCGGGGSW